MDPLVLVGRLCLAVVFGVAGIAKLADRAGSRRAMAGFGLPERVVTPAASILPLTEVVVGAAMIPSATVGWAALGGLLLLITFVVAIGINLARGRQPDCHCFGQLHSSPAGWPTLIRNGGLAAVAALVLSATWRNPDVGAPAQLLSKLSGRQAVAALVGVAIFGAQSLLVWLVVHMLRQQGRLLLRIEALEAAASAGVHASTPDELASDPAGLAVSSPAPEFTLPGLHGETLTLAALRGRGKPVMLLFTAVGCGPCEALMPEIGRWQREYATALTIAVLSSGPVEAVATIARDHGLTYVLRQDGYEVAQQYRYVGTPGAVVVSIDGTISTPVVGGADAIRALLSQVVGKPQPAPLYRRSVPAEQQESHHHGPPPSTGDPAPKLRLSDSKGAVVDLADFEGREVVLLFWNPACRFCEQMLPDLRAWDERPPVGAPMLAVVSIGSSASSASIGLRSPVLLDPESSAMHAFGANGTPMAIRLAADGTIASSLAVGKQEVFRLLGLDDGASLLEESQG